MIASGLHRVPFVGILVFVLALLVAGPDTRGQTQPVGIIIEIDGPIGPATADYVERTLKQGAERGVPLAILRLDTPGGLDLSMRTIVQAIMVSPFAVVVYVAPSGAHAASAGTYILYASHLAAMAPGTNIGAATPVQIGGGPPRLPSISGDEEQEKPKYPTIADKSVSDAKAYIRSLAQARGRNVVWAEKAVSEAASLSADEALAENVIEIIATDMADLMRQLDGRVVGLPSGQTTLRTEGLLLESIEPDWRTKLLSVITNPNVAYILLIIGIYGLVLEFYNPGIMIAGITGVICLLLALYAVQLLPISYTGLALILLGIALMVAEAFAPSFGLLGIGGAVAFVLGSVMLIDVDAPGFGVSPVLIGSLATVSAGLFLFVILMLMRARSRAVVSGPEEMINSLAEVLDWREKNGHVRAHGEIWKAESDREIRPGTKVRITSIDGLILTILPVSEEDSQ